MSKEVESNPAKRMAGAKVKLIERLRAQIKQINAQAIKDVEKVEGRIRVAQTLLDALKKGTLKP